MLSIVKYCVRNTFYSIYSDVFKGIQKSWISLSCLRHSIHYFIYHAYSHYEHMHTHNFTCRIAYNYAKSNKRECASHGKEMQYAKCNAAGKHLILNWDRMFFLLNIIFKAKIVYTNTTHIAIKYTQVQWICCICGFYAL